MANHVKNRLKVTGPKVQIQMLRNRASFYHPDYHGREDTVDADNPARGRTYISFWNFIRPEESTWPTYFAPAGGDMFKDPQNWYKWNYANWGTKWDAYDTSLTEAYEADKYVNYYHFTTANDAPLPVLEKMMELFPTLSFRLDYEDEAGPGGRIRSAEGLWVTEASFGRPTSHAESTRAERLRPCRCESDDQAPFADCPVSL